MAQKEAAIPIKPTTLSPSKRWSKSKMVMLKTINAKAKNINM